MSAASGKMVTVFGGSGFVGRHVVRALARRGWRIRVAVRRPDKALFLQPLGTVGQIMPVQANLRYRWSIERALEGADAAVNLVGILHESGRQTFAATQAFGARAVAEAVRDAGIARFVQISAIGARPDSPSLYGRTKAEGEQAALAAVPSAIVMRPSVVFGPEDSFFNRFAGIAGLSPFLPLFGGGRNRMQPVFVGDVAEAIARALDDRATPGTIYELGGPEVKTFRELMALTLETIGRERLLLPLPFAAGRLAASVLGLLPKPLVTADQLKLLAEDNVVSAEAIAEGRTLEGLGIQPTAMEAVLASYLVRYRVRGQFAGHQSGL
ncbi:complex I NDUFA9 subunit family protein [Prosthecomicrobium pneumaticum]|uniref:NADH dehydrogenase n=1 Tax=Prosthecomicrobium pneumaticum TaxID=81895 RepID=A0A7W9CTY2_9HYPH|nr:complex I NDUFA9 subunit family protein [Prosthecomicrobium pneumaticum]MBB5751835.1 NADH dehydrogenase [Prosthecomicrobium pneumaticum]